MNVCSSPFEQVYSLLDNGSSLSDFFSENNRTALNYFLGSFSLGGIVTQSGTHPY